MHFQILLWLFSISFLGILRVVFATAFCIPLSLSSLVSCCLVGFFFAFFLFHIYIVFSNDLVLVLIPVRWLLPSLSSNTVFDCVHLCLVPTWVSFLIRPLCKYRLVFPFVLVPSSWSLSPVRACLKFRHLLDPVLSALSIKLALRISFEHVHLHSGLKLCLKM